MRKRLYVFIQYIYSRQSLLSYGNKSQLGNTETMDND